MSFVAVCGFYCENRKNACRARKGIQSMKKILMRAGMSPLDNLDAVQVLTRNTIGNNIGNMLFPYSIMRTLMKEDTQIDTIIPENVPKKDIGMINETYDCFVLPFANAFRVSFISNLRKTTKLIEQLTIPCIVVGVGMQQKLGGAKENPQLDEAVTDFMRAVLKKSSMVGVRGEETGKYLKRLGFTPEKDYTVIGCPSMYLYGKNLPKVRLTDLTPQSALSFNSKISLPQKFHDFIYRETQTYKHYHYVPQVIEEIYRMYAGMPYPEGFVKEPPRYFPMKSSNEIYRKKKGVSFINVPSWMEYLKGKDLSVGSRIHGNIAAILAGTPSFVIVSDKRILELVEYHHIPHITMDQLTPKTTVDRLYQKADYGQLYRGHEQRFKHYLDFLQENGLETIYNEDGDARVVPFDEKIASIQFHGPLYSISSLNPHMQAKRMETFMGYYRDRVKELEKKNKNKTRRLSGQAITGWLAGAKE